MSFQIVQTCYYHGRYICHQTWTLVRISNISLLLFSSPKCRSAAAARAKKQAAQILQLLPPGASAAACRRWNDVKNTCHVSGVCCTALQHLGTGYTASYHTTGKFCHMQKIKGDKAMADRPEKLRFGQRRRSRQVNRTAISSFSGQVPIGRHRSVFQWVF